MPNIFLKNTTNSAITVAKFTVHYIDSTNAELVEVERTQPLEILLGFTWNSDSSELESVDISNDDYWSRVISQHDKELLQSLGLFVNVDFLKYGSLKKDSSYTYTVIGVYTGIGEGEISADLLSHFTVGISSSHPTYQNVARIICDTSVPVLVKTWKCRISISVTNKYNAFKYTLNGTPYYYVLDGVHDKWVDDLSSIGYHFPTPTLPTVTTELLGYYYKATDSSTVNLGSGGSIYLCNATGTNLSYNSTVSYAVYSVFSSKTQSTGAFCSYLSISEGGSGMKMTNDDSSSVQVHRVNYATCSSNQATVVTVYNSSNVAYNAFKFTESGTDYYYVLDGTQTKWTDDLSSIGYSLTFITQRAYLTTPPHTNKYMDTGRDYTVCDNSGNHITYDSSKTYNVVRGFRVDGTSVSSSFTLLGSFGILNLKNNGSRIEVGYVEYYTT